MINFRKITEDDLTLILRWRTDPEVTRYMSTDIEFDLEKQTNWYNQVVCTRSPAEHWIISHNERPVGILYLEKYNSTCSSKGMLDSKDLDGTIVYLLSNMSKYINGQNIIIDDGWSL